MEVAFLFNGQTVTAAQRAYVERKVRAAAKALHQPQRAAVDINCDKHGVWRVEVTISEPGPQYRAVATGASVEAAVDTVEVKLQEQIRDDHNRRRALERRGARSIKKKAVIDQAARF